MNDIGNFLNDFEINEFAIQSYYQANYFAKNEINSTDSICFETASSSELNSLIQNLFNFRNDQKKFPEALRTKCDDSLISCG